MTRLTAVTSPTQSGNRSFPGYRTRGERSGETDNLPDEPLDDTGILHTDLISFSRTQRMNIKKPEPLLRWPKRNACPVCGKASYSSAGIHPQCAMARAERLRRAKLAVERQAIVPTLPKGHVNSAAE